MTTYTTEARGSEFTLEFRKYFKNSEGQILSAMHDIPLLSSKEPPIYNMVVEVPRWSNAKMELSTKEPLAPIKQDIKKGKLRFVNNCFPYHGYLWNYGAFPQTWEDPGHVDPRTNAKGDNDPLDVCEIGSKIAVIGEVKQVKILGGLAMIDEGETDWKIIACDVTDPLAAELNDIDDVNKLMPGLLNHTYRWFQIYKIPTGKPPSQFGLEGKFQSADFARKVAEETHQQWKRLIGGEVAGNGGLDISNTSVQGSAGLISQSEASSHLAGQLPAGPPAPLPETTKLVDFVKDL
ncbi:Inorganic pyrophosphatase-like [Oopsacas minuta]|uniref:Inorganic pyrophosphatase n=1 Tax=Oopsacas minuta TaxID=111878 RepID=A0AAV7K7Q0_9METZ|nr:Inorganic pyrophosphatase-like [Oopsacas minuta]